MQANNINITPGNTQTLPCVGTGFWFESGTSSTTNPYIVVKPDTGAEIVLKPGQHFQDAAAPTGTWRIYALDPTAAITGRVIIGNGEFGDSNISNTFKLDGTFTNSVNVNNTTAAPANVAIVGVTTATPLPVVIPGTVKTAQGAMTYTNSFASQAVMSNNGVLNILPAASNVNGAILNQTLVSGANGTSAPTLYSFIAKATAPTSPTDGDVLDVVMCINSSISNFQNQNPIQVAAGKGIWVIATNATNADGSLLKAALVTVL
jgi:hypothetical protein